MPPHAFIKDHPMVKIVFRILVSPTLTWWATAQRVATCFAGLGLGLAFTVSLGSGLGLG
jgi:hypothetical protein